MQVVVAERGHEPSAYTLTEVPGHHTLLFQPALPSLEGSPSHCSGRCPLPHSLPAAGYLEGSMNAQCYQQLSIQQLFIEHLQGNIPYWGHKKV